MQHSSITWRVGAVSLGLLPSLALADTAAIDSGDTAWMITATALVLMMTIPGLSLFYAGLVRSKNVLSVLMQCFALTGLMSLLWAIYGYSLASTDGGTLNQWIGGLDKLFLSGVTVDAVSGTSTPFAMRIARNVQLILLEEANLTRLVDPAGRAYQQSGAHHAEQ